MEHKAEQRKTHYIQKPFDVFEKGRKGNKCYQGGRALKMILNGPLFIGIYQIFAAEYSGITHIPSICYLL